MTVLLKPPPDIAALLAQIPSAEDFTAARMRRALRFLIDSATTWLGYEETQGPSGDACFQMHKEELNLSVEELDWFLAHLPKGYSATHQDDGVTLLIFAP